MTDLELCRMSVVYFNIYGHLYVEAGYSTVCFCPFVVSVDMMVERSAEDPLAGMRVSHIETGWFSRNTRTAEM